MTSGIHEGINWAEEMRDCEKNLPPDVRKALLPDEKPQKHASEEILEQFIGDTQNQTGDTAVVQNKPMPNLHGKWSDDELVINLPSPVEARIMYEYATTMLLPGEVNLNLDYEANQFTVHLMPMVAAYKPDVVTALLDELIYKE